MNSISNVQRSLIFGLHLIIGVSFLHSYLSQRMYKVERVMLFSRHGRMLNSILLFLVSSMLNITDVVKIQGDEKDKYNIVFPHTIANKLVRMRTFH